MDLLITSLVFWIAMFQQRGREKGTNPIPFVALNLLISLSSALPVYLNARVGESECAVRLNKSKGSGFMDRYMIETLHTENNCHLALNEVSSMGYLHHFDWGCAVGVHCGWAIIEAENEDQALLVVPLVIRDSARAIRLIKYSPEMARELHSE